jgi:hypothetical protein
MSDEQKVQSKDSTADFTLRQWEKLEATNPNHGSLP